MIDSLQAQLPGVALKELIERNIRGILRKEHLNSSHIHLYRTGNYWATFEKSAYLLHSHCRNVWVFPIKVADISNPIVMASIECERLDAIARTWDCRLDGDSARVYKSRMTVDAPIYQAWHNMETFEIMTAMNEGMIP